MKTEEYMGTLADWRAVNPNMPIVELASGAFQVFAGKPDWFLFHLSDYAVSSAVGGPSYILVPREREED